jgi:hypothetical protein
MVLAPSPLDPTPPASGGLAEIVVVVESWPRGAAGELAAALRTRAIGGLDGRRVSVLAAVRTPEVALVDPEAAPPEVRPAPDAGMAGGGMAGHRSALGAFLREVDRRGAAGGALVVGDGRDENVDWLRLLVSPILEGGFECVCPGYRRARFEGLVNTAILYPLTRALYGLRLRQPAGGEAAVSLGLARHLLADPDWRRDPVDVGSGSWLVAKVLSERRRVCQAWLGRWPGGAAAPEDASSALAQLVGPAFREMERHPARWQRLDGSEPVPSASQAGADDGPAEVDVAALAARFQLGLQELDPVWGLVLSPATRLALRRSAGAAPEALHLDDALWARVVYDFAVAFTTRAVERGQLLRSLTPLYLGWVAGFANDVRGRDGAAVAARIESLCTAFEREKRYLIGRWRWPDSFNP